jgi:hypothetical protein
MFEAIADLTKNTLASAVVAACDAAVVSQFITVPQQYLPRDSITSKSFDTTFVNF